MYTISNKVQFVIELRIASRPILFLIAMNICAEYTCQANLVNWFYLFELLQCLQCQAERFVVDVAPIRVFE